jgi:hypothetical protein
MTRLVVAVGCALALGGPVTAQQCLHGANETQEQRTKRKQAVAVARVVNSLQASQPGAAQKRYLRQEELAAFLPEQAFTEWVQRPNFTPNEEVLPGWQLKLDVSTDGYWFIIEDKTDPCRFAFISNTAGIIYTAEPIR